MDNYVEAFFGDARFIPILITTARNALIDLPCILVFSLSVALLVNQDIRGKEAFRPIFFLPVVIGSGIVIRELFGQGVGREMSVFSTPGVAEVILTYLGPDAVNALFNLLSRVMFILWRTGVQILIFIAGLNGIPRSLYEAAHCDGISEWEAFWKITLPMISPIIWLNVIYTIIDSFTDVFNPILHYIRNTAFTGHFRMGYAAAIGWIYFLFIFVVIMAALEISRRYTFYAGER